MSRMITILGCLTYLVILLPRPLRAEKQEAWVEVRSPNFIVVSDAGEKEARKTATRFEQIRAVFRNSLAVASAHPSLMVTILALKDEAGLRSLLPDFWAKGHFHPAGIFAYEMNQYYAAINLQAQGSNPYATLYHEYYHSLTLPYYTDLPLWLAEGLATFFGNTEVNEKYVTMGEATPELVQQLHESKLIPLDVLFKVDRNSPYYNESSKTTIFYAESWVLTHYFLTGDHEGHRQALADYLKELDGGATQEQAAAKAFGDLNKLQRALESYLVGGTLYYMRAPAPPAVPNSDLHSRPLSEAEVGAYRGGFMAVRGKPDDAKPILEQAIRTNPNVALAYQNLALAQFFTGDFSEALSSAARAIELEPRNVTARYLHADLAFKSGGRFGHEPQFEDDLRQAIAADPNFAPAYPLLAECLASNGTGLIEALALAQKGITLEPGNYFCRLALAQVLLRMNRFDDAEASAINALRLARQPQETASAQSFLSSLQQVPAIRCLQWRRVPGG